PPHRGLVQRLSARPVVWLTVAGLAVALSATSGWLWSRQQFDMVKTLAYLAEHEGTWDNPWDLQERRIASLQSDIRAEASPIKRLILRRELAQNEALDRKSTRLNSSHRTISYAVFCL